MGNPNEAYCSARASGTMGVLTVRISREIAMPTQKQFKVASISSNANSFGLYGHVLMAEDGESWQVGRSRSGTSLPRRGKRFNARFRSGCLMHRPSGH